MTFEYFVAATPRSGSDLLCEGLVSTGVAGRPYEWFSRALVHHHLGEWQMRAASSRPLAPAAAAGTDYIGRVREACVTRDVRTFKIHWNQVEWFAASNIGGSPWDVLTQPLAGIPVVSLRRRNVAAQAVSSLMANQTQVFHRDREGKELSFELQDEMPGAPHYDFGGLTKLIVELLRHELAWDSFLRQHRCRVFTLYYEELADGFEDACARVLMFLDRPAVPPAPPRLIRLSGELNSSWEQRLIADLQQTGVIQRLPARVAQRVLWGRDSHDE